MEVLNESGQDSFADSRNDRIAGIVDHRMDDYGQGHMDELVTVPLVAHRHIDLTVPRDSGTCATNGTPVENGTVPGTVPTNLTEQIDGVSTIQTVAQPSNLASVPRENLVAHSTKNDDCAQNCATNGTPDISRSKSGISTKPKRAQNTRQFLGTRAPKSAPDRGRVQRISPPSITHHEWRFTGTGWSLFTRKLTRNADGKRVSERKYLRWYSAQAIERMQGYGRKKDTNRSRNTDAGTTSGAARRSNVDRTPRAGHARGARRPAQGK